MEGSQTQSHNAFRGKFGVISNLLNKALKAVTIKAKMNTSSTNIAGKSGYLPVEN
jgi:hypothetical protein